VARRSGLGKGLGALIPTDVVVERGSDLLEIPLTAVHASSRQPRQHFDEESLASLTASVRELGILQPVLVRRLGDSYQLIAGERRFRAAKRAGLASIPAIVREADDATSLEHALAFHRVTNPLYTEAMLRHRVEHGTRPVEGGLTWKYDRGLRDAVRAGTWRDPIDLWPLWRAITCPILLVRGADSDVLSTEIAERMLDENPATHFAEVPGAGHTVPGDQPTAFRTLLNTFLSG